MMTTLSNFIRGDDWNARKQSIVSLAFSSMDKSGSGVIEPEILLSSYRARSHPDVIAGRISADNALKEFLTTFDVGSEVEGKVTRREFENYYKKVSCAEICDDESFELMIRGVYGILGGSEQNSQNSPKSKLLAQNNSDENTCALNQNIERERKLKAEQANLEAKAVLDRLSKNREPKDISPEMLKLTLNSSKIDPNWEMHPSSRMVAMAGPNALPTGHQSPPKTNFLAPVVPIPAGVAHIISKLKAKLRQFGAYGFVGLQRTFRAIDKGDRKRLSMNDFKDVMKKMNVGLNDAEVRMLFDYFNTDNRGTIDSEHFITNVRDTLTDKRLNLVKQAFAKLDVNGEGFIDAGDVAQIYDAENSPDVIAGRMSSEEAFEEFLGTFDVGGEIDNNVTISEFVNYYTNIGASIENDDYFALMIRNAWHIGGDNTNLSLKRVLVTRTDGSQYMEEIADPNDDRNGKNSMLGRSGVHTQTFSVYNQANDVNEPGKSKINLQTRPLYEVSQRRHVGLNNTPSLISSLIRPPSEGMRPPKGTEEAIALTGPSSPRPVTPKGPNPSLTVRTPNYGVKYIIMKLKEEVRSFGLLGFIGLQRRFRSIDKEMTKSLSLSDFKKAMRQMNINLSDGELRMMFEYYDEENTGLINYEEFVQGVRDALTGERLSLVKQAFNQLDKEGSGILDAGEVAGMYDASKHPDVISGSTSPQQVLSSFLETFDVGCVIPGKVTLQEFINYYSNISDSLENDDYFELMMRNVWHIDQRNDPFPDMGAAGRRVLKTKADGTQYVEETKEARFNGLMDSEERAERAAIVAKLQGSTAPPDVSPYASQGARASTQDSSVHKIIQLNKRRSFHHRSTTDILSDSTVKKRPANDRGPAQPNAGVQIILDRLRGEVLERGAQSLIGLLRAFRGVDADSNKLLSLSEFKQAMRDMHMDLHEPEMRQLFVHFDTLQSGVLDYEQFLLAIRNPLSDWRLSLVKRAFSRLDRMSRGFIEASRCAMSYDAANHPEVIAGRMTAERALKEFLDTFDVQNNKITVQSFIDYYEMIGSTIENDEYFELMITNTWHAEESVSEEKENLEASFLSGRIVKEPASIQFAAGGKSSSLNKSSLSHTAQLSWIGNDNSAQFDGYGERNRVVGKEANLGERLIITNLRKGMSQRALGSGYIAMQRKFHSMDADGSKLISLPEFMKVSKDLRLGMNDTECRVIFTHFDRNNMGLMDYRLFIEGIRPRLSQQRMELVTTAFRSLDINNAGVIDAKHIIEAFDPTGHPDVFLGVKSAEAVMQEWLNTFDVGGTVKGKVTKDEFINYYSNIGALVENEDYFELMLIHAWKPQRAEKNEIKDDQIPVEIQIPDEPELESRATVTFSDLLQKEEPVNPRFTYSDTVSKSTVMSPSMHNWIEANIVSGSKGNTKQGGSSRHYPMRKSQIHFN